MIRYYDVIRGPVVTEKTTLQRELANQVTFKVDRGASRVEIKRAVEKNFSVAVKQVRTLQVKGKVKTRGKIKGRTRDWKKAVVTLMPGQKIEFFEGV